MNICILSGRIKGNPVPKTSKGKETKVLSFVVETINPYNGGERRDLVSCVIFNCDETLEHRLIREGDGLWVEAEGRVSSSSLKTAGQRTFNTDVILRHWTFAVVHPEGEP